MVETFELIDESLLSAVALFPLPNVVLVPGSLQPLHIFEPRYRDMTRDVLAGSRLLAMARLKPGYEADYHGRPDVYRIVGIGRVIASDELDDGRYNILVRGLARAELDEELPAAHLYRQIRARILTAGTPPEPAVLAAMHQKLIMLCDQLAMTLDQGGEQLRELVRTDGSPSGCSDVVCAALVTNIDHRQRFLEMSDPMERLTFAIQYVGRLLAEFGPSARLMS
jgi:Lon protease-like protein